MNRRARKRVALASVGLLSGLAWAFQSPAPKQTVHVSTHLVQISVSVRDHNAPVLDLTKDDLVVLDRGKPRKISILETLSTESQPAARPQLQPNTFTNLPRYETNQPRSITIVLLDNLNTLYGSAPLPYETSPYWMEDLALANAKSHLIEFIRNLDSRDRVAIYGLSRSLHVVCDFTSDRTELLKVLRNYDTTSLTRRELVEPGRIHTPGGPQFDASVNRSAGTMAATANASRADATMAALQSIAQHVASIPGRKNLVWLTSNLPFSPQAMAAILSPAQIAVYPVDGRGLQPSMSLQSLEGVMNADAAARGDFSAAQSPEPIGIQTMIELAQETGGEAAVNSNGLTGAIRRAVEYSAATYQLGFYVEKASLDGKFHPLKLQVRRPGLTIQYPRGYFATEGFTGTHPEPGNALLTAIHSPFEWSALHLLAKVARQEQSAAGSLEIVGAVGLKNVQLTQRGETWTGTLMIYIVEQDLRGKVLSQHPDRLRLRLSQQQYDEYLRSGIVFHERISPRSDSAIARVLVEDPATTNIGTVIIPLAQVQ